MKIIECKQGSDSWMEARLGMPTASCFDKIMTPVKRQPSAQADDYIAEIIADRIRGGPEDVKPQYSREMERGVMVEPEARRYYTFHTGLTVQQVGFVTTDDGKCGASPDGLIGEDGGVEIKCPLGKTHTTYLLKGVLPTEYACQVHGSLIVTGRQWWDFLSYAPGMPPFLIRVVPDDFTEVLRKALDEFLVKLESKYNAVLAMV